MMDKRNFIQATIITVTTATFIFLTYSLSIAAGDCSDQERPNTCWNFASGYEIQLKLPGEPGEGSAEGLIHWQYEVFLKNKTAAKNHILFALEAGLSFNEENSNESQSYDACEGDPTYNYLVYDCLRQAVRWSPTFNEGRAKIDVYVEPVVDFGIAMPIAVGTSGDLEPGKILGPTSEARDVSATFVVDQSSDGSAVATDYDFSRDGMRYWICNPTEDCDVCDRESFPRCFTELDHDEDTIDINQVIVCLPPDEYPDPPPYLPQNGILQTAGGDSIPCHWGYAEFWDEDARFRIGNRSLCKNVYGRLICN